MYRLVNQHFLIAAHAFTLSFFHSFATVNFVFNRRLSVSSTDGQKIDGGENCEGTMVVYKEISDTAGKNSPQHLNNSKLDNNGNHVLEKEATHPTQVVVEQESLDGVDVNSSKNREITGTTLGVRSTTTAKNVGGNTCEEKDKVKDVKLSASQDNVEKGVKHARKSCDFDDAPSKRAKVNGSVPSDSNGVQGVKDSAGCRKDAKVSEESNFVEKLSQAGVSLSAKGSSSGHVKDGLGLQEVSKSKDNPNALQGNSSSVKEKLGAAHRKGSIVAKDKKVGESVSACEEKTSKTNEVSHDATQSPSTTDIPSKQTPLSGPNKKVEGSGKVTKPAQSLSTTKKRPLEISAKKSKEEPHLGHDKSHENKEKKGGDSCPEEYPKKAKLDNTVKCSEDNDNSKEKNQVGQTKKLPKITSCNNNAKSRLGEGPSKENHHEKEKSHVGKSRNSPTPLTRDDNPKSKLGEGPSKENHNEKNNHVGKMKNSPKPFTCDNKAMSKLGERPSKEYHKEKDGKLSNDKLPNTKVGGDIIEVTRRPLVSWPKAFYTLSYNIFLIVLHHLER